MGRAYIRSSFGEHDYWLAVVMIDGDNSETIYHHSHALRSKALSGQHGDKGRWRSDLYAQHKFKSLFADYASNWMLEVKGRQRDQGERWRRLGTAYYACLSQPGLAADPREQNMPASMTSRFANSRFVPFWGAQSCKADVGEFKKLWNSGAARED